MSSLHCNTCCFVFISSHLSLKHTMNFICLLPLCIKHFICDTDKNWWCCIVVCQSGEGKLRLEDSGCWFEPLISFIFSVGEQHNTSWLTFKCVCFCSLSVHLCFRQRVLIGQSRLFFSHAFSLDCKAVRATTTECCHSGFLDKHEIPRIPAWET